MNLNVLVVSNQIRGIDGAGGLGDVPVGLSRVLAGRGDLHVCLIMPGFDKISGKGLDNRFDPANLVLRGLAVPLASDTPTVDVYRIPLPSLGQSALAPGPDVQCYLLRCPQVFDAPGPGGGPDKNSPRTAVFFARAVLSFLRAYEDFRVDLIHCNDWHAGLIPVCLRTLYCDDPYLGRVATLYTSHNAEGGFQGAFPQWQELLALAGLDPAEMFRQGERFSLHHYDQFNFCKGGFAFADVVNTVSRQYREELLTPAFGGSLDGLLQLRGGDFCGIINGIDTVEWNPKTDAHVAPHNYSIADGVDVVLERKRRIREILRKEACFSKLRDDSILIGIVSRIDYQKLKILVPAMDALLAIEDDFQIALLGNEGQGDDTGKEYVDTFRAYARQWPDKFLFLHGFNIPVSHVLLAASEMFLVPSVFEPCGLTQLAAMAYGSVPVVRSVGGLVDTVVDEGDATRKTSATGFCFKERIVDPKQRMNEAQAPGALVAAVERALRVRRKERGRWNELVVAGMSRDWSWQVPSMQYVKLYHEAVRRCAQRTFFGPR